MKRVDDAGLVKLLDDLKLVAKRWIESGRPFSMQKFKDIVPEDRRKGTGYQDYVVEVDGLRPEWAHRVLVYSILGMGLMEAELQRQMYADGAVLRARNQKGEEVLRLLESGLASARDIVRSDWDFHRLKWVGGDYEYERVMFDLGKRRYRAGLAAVDGLAGAVAAMRKVLAPREEVWDPGDFVIGTGERPTNRPPKPWKKTIERLLRMSGVNPDSVYPLLYPLTDTYRRRKK